MPPKPFDVWYAEEYKRLLAAVTLFTSDREVAIDAVDEACSRTLAAWGRVGQFEHAAGWTYRVAVNIVRRRVRRQILERQFLARQVPTPFGVPYEGTLDVWAAVRRLPYREREAVVLRYIMDMPEATMANVMKVRRGTVSATLSKARQHLAQALQGTEEMEPK